MTTGRARAACALPVIAVAATLCAALVSVAPAGAARLPAQIWAIQLPTHGTVNPQYLGDVAATGVNAVIVDAAAYSPRLRSAALRTGGITVLVAYAPGKACPALRAPAACATRAPSVAAAAKTVAGKPPVVVLLPRLDPPHAPA